MMRARTTTAAAALSPEKEKDVKWEVRPCGMLVQKRGLDTAPSPPPPAIRVRVKYAGAHHEIFLSSQATFGDLKKLLAERTGLHPQDQKLLYKDKERDSAAYLDMAGVKDRSKMVLVEDSAAQARRVLEMRKNAKMEKAAKAMTQTAAEIDKLATKVSSLEAIASKGKKVAEGDVVGLTEQLMNLLVKLDALVLDKNAEPQRGTQVRRVQRLVETLDALKMKNSQKGSSTPAAPLPSPPAKEWETFDLLSGPPLASAAAPGGAGGSPAPRLDWELF
ncbi:BCL-2-associated athanogene 1 [Wolffia australiana]